MVITKEEKLAKKLELVKLQLSAEKKKNKSLSAQLATSKRKRLADDLDNKKKDETDEYICSLLNDINSLSL